MFNHHQNFTKMDNSSITIRIHERLDLNELEMKPGEATKRKAELSIIRGKPLEETQKKPRNIHQPS